MGTPFSFLLYFWEILSYINASLFHLLSRFRDTSCPMLGNLSSTSVSISLLFFTFIQCYYLVFFLCVDHPIFCSFCFTTCCLWSMYQSCINTVWIFCFLRPAVSVFIFLLFQHASLRYLSFYYCVRVSEPLRAFPPFFELSSSPGWLSGLSYFLSPSVLLENIFTATTVLLFISLVLLGLIQIDWCFDILPTVSEIFFFFFFVRAIDVSKSWKNAKDGVGELGEAERSVC